MKRNSRVTADVTIEAHNLLRAACDRYDSSKGKLMEKMIRNFCGDVTIEKKPIVKKTTAKKFKPPTVEEVFNYCNERCNKVDAQNFVDFYSAKDWMMGKNKIKDWKACVRTWEKKSESNNGNGRHADSLSMASRLSASSVMLYRRNTASVLCPVMIMATD